MGDARPVAGQHGRNVGKPDFYLSLLSCVGRGAPKSHRGRRLVQRRLLFLLTLRGPNRSGDPIARHCPSKCGCGPFQRRSSTLSKTGASSRRICLSHAPFQPPRSRMVAKSSIMTRRVDVRESGWFRTERHPSMFNFAWVVSIQTTRKGSAFWGRTRTAAVSANGKGSGFISTISMKTRRTPLTKTLRSCA